MREVYREYVIRKYVRARTAEEAIRLSESLPVVEVNEMQEKPATSNGESSTHAVGFQYIQPDNLYEV